MRVLAYTDSPLYSGAEAVYADICLGLLERGHEVAAVVPAANRDIRSALGAVPIVAEIPAQPQVLAALRALDPRRLRQIRHTLRPLPTDVWLVNLPSAELGIGPALARALRAPSVGILHVHTSLVQARFRAGRCREPIARLAMPRHDRLMVVDPLARDYVARTWGVPKDRVDVLPLRVPRVDVMHRALARERLGLPAAGMILMLIGRISLRQKGHDVLVRAAPAILREHPDLLIVFAGDGGERRELENKLRGSGLAGSVRFLGAVDPVGVALGAADLVVMPSRFEGLPLTALEALQAGVAGIASDVDGLRSVWPERWRVPPDNPGALSEAINALLAMPAADRQAVIYAARERMQRLTSACPAEHVEHSLRAAIAR